MLPPRDVAEGGRAPPFQQAPKVDPLLSPNTLLPGGVPNGVPVGVV